MNSSLSKKYRFALLGAILITALYWANHQMPVNFYIRPDVEVYLEVKSQKDETLFLDTIINTDLFVPAYLKVNHFFPLSFNFMTAENSLPISATFKLERSICRYVILDIQIVNEHLIMNKHFRYFRPVLQ